MVYFRPGVLGLAMLTSRFLATFVEKLWSIASKLCRITIAEFSAFVESNATRFNTGVLFFDATYKSSW